MTNETVVDPLQLVPHRIRVFKLIYESTCHGATAADELTDDVATRRELFDELKARNSDDFNRTKHTSSAKLR